MLGIKEKTYICSGNIPVCSAVRAHLLDRSTPGVIFHFRYKQLIHSTIPALLKEERIYTFFLTTLKLVN